MDLHKFTEEMLDEVKSIKDFAKGEIPEVVKEYLRASKIKCFAVLFFSIALILYSISAGLSATFLNLRESLTVFLTITAILAGGMGGGFFLGSSLELLNLYLQPKRTAIKAITSLKSDN